MWRAVWIGFILLASAVDVLAEPRTTTVPVTVRKRPGEKSPAVAQVPKGTAVVVLREEGRWLFVRVNNVEGYVTRTTVTTAPGETPTTTTGWSAPRLGGDAKITELFVDVITPTADLRAAPDATAATVTALPKGTKLAVIDAASHPGWLRGRDPAGHDGWIAREAVVDSATSIVVSSSDVKRADTTPGFRRPATAPRSLRMELGIGFRSLGMDLTSNGDGGLSNYLVDAEAVATGLRVVATARIAGRWFAAIDGVLQAGAASPGIDYPGPTAAAGKIPFRTVSTELGGRLGLRAGSAFDVFVRAAGHYDAFLPRDVENAGTLPRERLLGLVTGAGVEVLPPASPFTAALRVDVLAIGARAQTPGLEDGTDSTARAVWGGLTLRYSLTPRWTLFGDYEFGRSKTTWTGMSVRQPGVTSAVRIDTAQLVQLGVGAEL